MSSNPQDNYAKKGDERLNSQSITHYFSLLKRDKVAPYSPHPGEENKMEIETPIIVISNDLQKAIAKFYANIETQYFIEGRFIKKQRAN